MKKTMMIGVLLAVCVSAVAFADYVIPIYMSPIYVGETKAILDSPTSSSADITFTTTLMDPPKISWMMATTVAQVNLSVSYQIKDDSRTVGYNLEAKENLDSYNFDTWSWQVGGSGNSLRGSSDRFGKYNNYGSWNVAALQLNPLTKYKLILVADTKSKPTRTESKEFWVSSYLPSGTRTPGLGGAVAAGMIPRDSIPKWIVGRYERALLYRNLKGVWNQMRTSAGVPADFNTEMTKIFVSCGALFGPASASDYFKDSGMEVLGLVSTIFGNAGSAILMDATSVIYQGYSWGQWAKTTLQDSATLANEVINSVSRGPAISGYSQSMDTQLDAVANAMRDEAKEFMRITYTAPTASDYTWRQKLNAEITALKDLRDRTIAVKAYADPYFSINASDPAHLRVDNFLDSIKNMAEADLAVLSTAMTGTRGF